MNSFNINKVIFFFKSGHERSISVKKNVFASLLMKFSSILVNFAIVPITINFIATKDYGIWLTVSAIVSWFSFFDIGFGNGLRNKFAEAVAIGNNKLAKSYVSTTYVFLTILICFTWVLFLIFNKFINWSYVLGIDPSENFVITNVVYIIFSFFCMQFVLKLVSTILYANNQTAKASSFDLISQILLLVYVIFYTKFYGHGSLTILAIAVGGIQVFVLLLANLWFFSHELYQFKPSFKHVNFKHVKKLMGIGVKFFIIQLSAIFIFESTNVLISHLFGPDKVTTYNVVFRYFNIVAMICSIVAAPFWSYFTDAYIKGDFLWMRKVYKQLNLFWISLTFLAFFMLLISRYVFHFWVGSKVDIPYFIPILMFLNVIAVTRLNIFIALLNGIGKIQLQLNINIVISILFIPIAITFAHFFKINGIIIANILVNLIYAIVVPLQCKKILYSTAKGIWNR